MILLFYIASMETPLTVGTVLAWGFSAVTGIFSFLAWRFVKSYDDKIKEFEKKIFALEEDNKKLREEANNRLVLYIEKLGENNVKLTEVKTLLLTKNEK